MWILNRYIVREMVGPTLLGLGFYTFIILMRQLLDFAEMIIKFSLPVSTVVQLLALSLPHIVVLTIPMSLLFGILIAIGRLSSDSEIIAMRSAGISASVIYRPVFYFSVAVFLINLYLMNFVLPNGNTALRNLTGQIVTASVEREIQPRVFYDDYENLVMYVNDIDPETGTWNGVFVSATGGLMAPSGSGSGPRQHVIVADRGRLSLVEGSRDLWLFLQNAETHVTHPSNPERYDLNRNAVQKMALADQFAEGDQTQSRPKHIKEMNLHELFVELETTRGQDPVGHRLTRVEIHKKFSIPFACIAFGIVALPLGVTSRRGGRSSGFTLSIAIIVIYYILLSNGEDLASSGKLPPALAMWLPNLLLIAVGVYLLRRVNRDARGRGASRLPRYVSARLSRIRRPLPMRRSTERATPLARLDIAFPNTLDRYILAQFFKVLLLVLLSSMALFIIIDYTELADDIAERRIELDVVASYYRYFFLQILNWTLPLSVLLATLITFGLFARNAEITAIKALGVSLYRITLPVVVVASLLSIASYFLLDFVLPYSNRRLGELENQIKGRERVSAFTPQQRQWVFGRGRYLFNFLNFDSRERVLSQVQVFEFHPSEFRMTRRIAAEEARWDGIGWVFVNGWIRSFGDDGSTSYTPIPEPIRLHYPERPEYFALDVKAPDQMTFGELRRYIRNLKRSGYSAQALMVELYGKTSWPFVTLLMALIALPFSFRIGKRGALYGIGVALFLAFTYWSLFGIFTEIGKVGSLPAILAAWSANILFAIGAIYLFLHVET